MAKWRVGVEYSPSRLDPVRRLESVCPRAVSPDRELYLPTFSHFLIVNETSLSRSPGLRIEYQSIGFLVPTSISMSLLAHLGVGVSPCFRFLVTVCLSSVSFLFLSISCVLASVLRELCPRCSSPLVRPLRSTICVHLFRIMRCQFSKSVSLQSRSS